MNDSICTPLLPLLLAWLCLALACGGEPQVESGDEVAHEHTAPHGGTLVVLGQEQANVELVHDRDRGTLTVYLLDGHASGAVRSGQGRIEVSLSQPATLRPLELEGVASSLTGETRADTSVFQVTSPALAGAAQLVGKIASVEHRGTTYRGVAFRIPEDEEGEQ